MQLSSQSPPSASHCALLRVSGSGGGRSPERPRSPVRPFGPGLPDGPGGPALPTAPGGPIGPAGPDVPCSPRGPFGRVSVASENATPVATPQPSAVMRTKVVGFIRYRSPGPGRGRRGHPSDREPRAIPEVRWGPVNRQGRRGRSRPADREALARRPAPLGPPLPWPARSVRPQRATRTRQSRSFWQVVAQEED
jgi:hypothetical protein